MAEFIENYTAVQELEKNLKANLDALTDLSAEEKKALMRCNMIESSRPSEKG